MNRNYCEWHKWPGRGKKQCWKLRQTVDNFCYVHEKQYQKLCEEGIEAQVVSYGNCGR